MTKKQPKTDEKEVKGGAARSRFAYSADDLKGLKFEDAKKYSPDQARDEKGRWNADGSSNHGPNPNAAHEDFHDKDFDSEYPHPRYKPMTVRGEIERLLGVKQLTGKSRQAVEHTLALMEKYSPDQPRDEGGRFSSGGGGGMGPRGQGGGAFGAGRGSFGVANMVDEAGNAKPTTVFIPGQQDEWEGAGDLRAVPNMNDDDLKGWRDEYKGSTDDHERSMSRAARTELERREVQRARVGNALGGKPSYGLYDNSPEAIAHRQSLMDASNRQAEATFGGRRSHTSAHRGAFKATFFKADGVDEGLGLVFGWAIVCKEDGADYFDVQGDHIPEVSMLKAAADFMENSRVIKEMHAGDDRGYVVFAWPMTEDVAKAMGLTTKRTGLMIAVKPDSAEVLGKFKSGEYTGFSIGGSRVRDKVLED